MCMQLLNVLNLSREDLERLALRKVCACLYYDLADTIGETSDEELIKVIRGEYECDICELSE